MSSFVPSLRRPPAGRYPAGRTGGVRPALRAAPRRRAARPVFRAPAGRPWFRRVAGPAAAPAGLEWRFLRLLPGLAMLAMVVPLAPALIAAFFDASPEVLGHLLGWGVHGVVALWVALALGAVSAVIVYVMKGPAYEADPYWTDGTHRR